MRSLLCALLALAAAAPAAAADLDPLLQQSDRARGSDLPGFSWTISIQSHDDDGDRQQTMNAIASADNTRVDYTAPEKIRGQRIVMLGRNMWFARPGLQKPVPISPRQRLIGQASNGDVAATHYFRDYTALRSGTELVDGESCVIFELAARAKSVTYDRIRYWVSESRKVGVKAEFYTVSGKLFKTARMDYDNVIEYEGRRIPFVSRMRIQDALDASRITTLNYGNVRAKKPDPSLFELNS